MSTKPVTVGELFPAGDLIAQWVFQMTAVAEDLSVADIHLSEALKTDDDPALTSRHFRQLVARLYEAKRPILGLEQHATIRNWVEGLPGATSELDVLRAAYLPANKSQVDRAYGLTRHRSVHHVHVGSHELRELLEQASEEEAWCVVDHEKATLHYAWPEAVMARAVSGDLGDPDQHAAFIETISQAQRLMEAFGRLNMIALREHIKRVGVLAARFTREVGAEKHAREER